ncbi:redoxin family protein [Rhizobium sp. BK251]|uniref:redoxin family protein n=1 Tax=Rhizobium sp. BK251 TaxID=2512125 RepID=UPI00104E0C8A|nr:redoxin family protein [Rhizobium sp. BK251]TCL71817.1 peroxiredoxin [Rhizobium sp. BK251]
MPRNDDKLAPEISVSQWFNTPAPLSLEILRGRVVLLHSFQLLCPGCVADAIPQIRRIERAFASTDLAIIGLHTVFEHHEAMSPVTLAAFLHEYRIRYPVGVDQPGEDGPLPLTMRRYGLRGTPSSVLIGRDGTVLHHAFGVEDDIAVGARIAMALAHPAPVADCEADIRSADGCDNGSCVIP